MTIFYVEPNTNILKVKYTPVFYADCIQTLQELVQGLVTAHGRYYIHMDLQGLGITALVRHREWIGQIMQQQGVNQYADHLEEIVVFNAPRIATHIHKILSQYLCRPLKIRFIGKESAGSQDNLTIV